MAQRHLKNISVHRAEGKVFSSCFHTTFESRIALVNRPGSNGMFEKASLSAEVEK